MTFCSGVILARSGRLVVAHQAHPSLLRPWTGAPSIALRTEHGTGTSDRDPGWMHTHYARLKTQGIHLQPERWDAAFRTQTGQNINVSVNGIAKLLRMMSDDQ